MNHFQKKLEAKEFVISVEIAPAKDADLTQNMREVALFAPFVDIVNVTDSSMAKMRPAGFVVASLIQKKFDIDAIFNYTCRDRNVIGLKSDLLGALALGAVNVLAITGDTPKKGDHPDSKGVFEVSSLGLLEVITDLSPHFFPGAVINFSNNDRMIKKIAQRKKDAGAKYLISQPVYSRGRIQTLKEIQDELDIPVIAGILPIKSRFAAEYMQKEVTGITIPDDDFEIMQKIPDNEIFQRQVHLAARMVKNCRDIGLAGIHIMPLGRGDKIPDILGYNHEEGVFSFFEKSLKPNIY